MSSTTTIQPVIRIDGVLRDVTPIVLRDPTGAFGVKRTDTDAVVVAAGTALTRISTGVYEYVFTDPAPALTYDYWVEFVYNGDTFRYERISQGGVDAASNSYCTLTEGDAIAATMPAIVVKSYVAGDAAGRTAALVMGTSDIDAAGPYQGRKYDLWTPQVLQFPRVPYESAAAASGYGFATLGQWFASPYCGVQVWDYDPVAKAAIVPTNVKRACVLQANAILDGKLYKALDDMALGVASRQAGSVSVSYRDPAQLIALLGGMGSLCRPAGNLMKFYQIRQGRIL